MLFAYGLADFPKELIVEACLQHQEILFSKEEHEPELNKKKGKYANCYVVEDALESRKKGGNPKFQKATTNSHIKKPTQQAHQGSLGWKRGEQPVEEPGTGDFFDNFNGKTDQSKVHKFIKEKKFESLLQVTHENNIYLGPESNEDIEMNAKSQVNSISQPHSSKKLEVNYSKGEKAEEGKNIDKFFEDFDTSSSQSKEFNISCIYKVNDFLSYPKEEPLWYFYHEAAKSSFGPISSKRLEEMFHGKIIEPSNQVRFIDIFSHKLCLKKPFAYFKLSDINRPNFVSDIELSNLFYAAEQIIKTAKRNLLAEKESKPIEGESDSMFSDFSKNNEKKEKYSKNRKVDLLMSISS